MQAQSIPVKRKRFCCGAIKKLKDKCLRFHEDESKCIQFIKGHQECVQYKRIWQAEANSEILNH